MNRFPLLCFVCAFFCSLLLPFITAAQCTAPITTFPYAEDFESGPGGWSSGGVSDDWALGNPAKAVITGAAGGIGCWITGGLTGTTYNSGERSYVISPCFDFSSLTLPYIAVNIWWETEKQYDGANLQSSIDGGNSWQNVGSISDPAGCLNRNWFNYASVTNLVSLAVIREGWSGNVQANAGSCLGGLGSNGWVEARHTMPNLAGEPEVLLRFTFGSGTSCNTYDGFAFDDVRISEAPSVPQVTGQSTPAGCGPPDGTVTLNVTGGAAPLTYLWSPNVSSGTQATGLTAGTYTVIVSDATGCTASVQSTVTSTSTVSLSLSAASDTCSDSRGMATAQVSGGTSPFTLLWSNGSTSDTIHSISTGSYTLTVTDAAGCTATETVFIPDTGHLELDLGPDRIFCGTSAIILDPGSFSSYLWQDGTTVSPYAVLLSGTYAVEVTDARGCTATDSVAVTENCLNDLLFPNAFTPNGDGFNELFHASGSGADVFQLVIYNRWGQIVFVSSDISHGWDGKRNGMDVPAGIYSWKAGFSIGGFPEVNKTGTVLLLR